jgi:hypothetical protein
MCSVGGNPVPERSAGCVGLQHRDQVASVRLAEQIHGGADRFGIPSRPGRQEHRVGDLPECTATLKRARLSQVEQRLTGRDPSFEIHRAADVELELPVWLRLRGEARLQGLVELLEQRFLTDEQVEDGGVKRSTFHYRDPDALDCALGVFHLGLGSRDLALPLRDVPLVFTVLARAVLLDAELLREGLVEFSEDAERERLDVRRVGRGSRGAGLEVTDLGGDRGLDAAEGCWPSGRCRRAGASASRSLRAVARRFGPPAV